jgi:transposase
MATRKAAFAAGLPYPSSAKLQKLLITEAKQTPERAWLAEVSPVPLQQAVRDCDQAYRRFFKWLKDGRTGPKWGRDLGDRARRGTPIAGRRTVRSSNHRCREVSGRAGRGPRGVPGLIGEDVKNQALL